ncbi:MAG: SUMF1/EgtB/PvdO family nonheme iron enzyme [Phycisphaerales bacterium]|nr:SUMF1/EgtB/PvdO family nonheme iron enzyme [Phycisphaerales bacterium]
MPGAPSVPFSAAAQAQGGGAGPQVTYQYGAEFVTIPALNNAPFFRPELGNTPGNGAGTITQEFRIGRYEVTNAQWAAFFDAVAHVRLTGQSVPHVQNPTFANFTVAGGHIVSQAGREMSPVGGITWRTAAMYCNWLHNDQAVTQAAFMSGAYDVSTFGYVQGNHFTDQLTHTPGARFWIPTMNEVMASQHYDPNRYGPGQGGYWEYNITQDTRPTYGAPGTMVNGSVAQANSSWLGPGDTPGAPWSTPLGSYWDVAQSPWGLLDTAGGAGEWLETAIDAGGGNRVRLFHGSAAADGALQRDRIYLYPSDLPSATGFNYGLRIAAQAVPSPSSGAVLATTGVAIFARRRR